MKKINRMIALLLALALMLGLCACGSKEEAKTTEAEVAA